MRPAITVYLRSHLNRPDTVACIFVLTFNTQDNVDFAYYHTVLWSSHPSKFHVLFLHFEHICSKTYF